VGFWRILCNLFGNRETDATQLVRQSESLTRSEWNAEKCRTVATYDIHTRGWIGASNKCVCVRLPLIKIAVIKLLRLKYELHGYLRSAWHSRANSMRYWSAGLLFCSQCVHGPLHLIWAAVNWPTDTIIWGRFVFPHNAIKSVLINPVLVAWKTYCWTLE